MSPPPKKFHAIGFEGLVQNDTSAHVHHLLLFGFQGTDDCGQTCEAWFEANFPDDDGSTSGESEEGSSSTNSSSSTSFSNITIPDFCNFDYAVVFVWTPGAENAKLPEDVGFRFGNISGGFTSVSVQTHYDNPDGIPDLVDSSGVRVYYTEAALDRHGGDAAGRPGRVAHRVSDFRGKDVYVVCVSQLVYRGAL